MDQERIDWLYAQLSCLVEWDAPTGRPRVLPLYTALVDGLVVPAGERVNSDGLFSDKKKYRGQNVQVVATLSGRPADVGERGATPR